MRRFTRSSVALSCIVPVLLLVAQGGLAATVAAVWPPQPFHVMLHPQHHPQPGLIHHNRLVHHYGGAAGRGFHPPGFRLGPHSPHPLGFADTKFSARSGAPYAGRNVPSAAQYDPTGHGDPAFSFWNT